MNPNRIHIFSTNIATVYPLTLQVPEFAPHYPIERFYKRLNHRTHLILQANFEGKAAGFKVGYELDEGIFYSWVGGVLPMYRRKGIAQALADDMETWLLQHNYHTLRMKTHNRFKNMLLFAIGNGFDIIKVEEKDDPKFHRILLEKKL